MLKTLVKKQLLELNQFYFRDRKTGQNKTKGKTIFTIVLFVLILGSLGFAFYGIASMLISSFSPLGLGWLYFAILGLMTIFVGVLGSVFNTYAGLYLAKDNDLLLSLPIKPSQILLSRMIGVFVMSLLYTSIAWIPTILCYWNNGVVSALTIIIDVLLLFAITLFVSTLTCIFGYLVALISKKTKGKSFVTVLISLLFIGGYYYVYFNLMNLLKGIVNNYEAFEKGIRTWAYPIYQLGIGATGSFSGFIIFFLISIALFALCYFVMSKTFTKIATSSNDTTNKDNHKEIKIKTKSTKRALLYRELKHFVSSPTYMLNSGLGALLMIVAAVFALIKANDINNYFASISAINASYVSYTIVVAMGALFIAISIDAVTAPSISLEGKSLWIIRSLPVSSWSILQAKESLAKIVNAIPAIISAIAFCVALKCDFQVIVLVIVNVYIYVVLAADFGLVIGLKKPMLNWTNEAIPIKQSGGVLIAVFGGMIFSIIVVALPLLFADKVNVTTYLTVLMVVMVLIRTLIVKWLMNKGTVIFESLID